MDPRSAGSAVGASLLVHAAGAVCLRFRTPFSTEKATRRKKPRAKRRAAWVGSKATCWFITVSKFSLGLCSSSCYDR